MKNFLIFIFATILCQGVFSQEVAKQVAHSTEDWNAAGENIAPEQGFRNWSFGYYEVKDNSSTFKPLNHFNKNNYWGDGKFTYGAIFIDKMTSANAPEKYTVVRRWTVPKDGSYILELEGSHVLKSGGQEVSWGKNLFIYVDGKEKEKINFPGKKITKKTISLNLKKDDKLDFAAPSIGGTLFPLTIVIKETEKGLTVIENKKSSYNIVIPNDDPGSMSQKAADLLQRVILESTGAKLAIIKESEHDNSSAFYIGKTQKAINRNIIPEDLLVQEYIKRIDGNDIFLIGVNRLEETDVRGKRYRPGDYKAVCSFLEDELGARFMLPGKYGEEIPKKNALVLPTNLNIRHCPPFPMVVSPYQILIGRDKYEPYATANNSIDNTLMRFFYGHSWPNAVPVSKYGKSNPEYFVLQNGIRRPEKPGNQLCISNPEVIKLFHKQIEDSYNTGFRYMQLSQSDAFFACECDECKKLGTAHERLWNNHLLIAEEAYKKFPDFKLHIIAYEYTQEPPQWIEKFPPNVIIELSKYDEEEFKKWQKYNVQHMVYNYNWGVYNESGFLPKRTPKFLARQLKTFKKYDVISIYCCFGMNSFMGLDAPTAYIYGRLLDNLELDPDILLTDYCRSAFGNSAGIAMENFFSLMYTYMESIPENAYFTTNDHTLVRTAESMITAHYPTFIIKEMEEYLKKAELLTTTEKQKLRLQWVRAHFNYMKSVVKATSAFRTFQLEESYAVFQIICNALQERQEAIKELRSDKMPALWKSDFEFTLLEKGGTQKGILGAPFSWNYQEMLKSGILPIVKTKEAKATQLKRAPKLDDNQWNELPIYQLEKVSGGKADIPSEFQIGWDMDNLYIRFVADTPNLASKTFESSGKEQYIRAENFDIFINPTGQPDRFFQFIFSPAENSFLDGNMNIGRFGADPNWNKLDLSWDGNWKYEYKLYPEKNKWHALLKIPFSSLRGFKPQKDKSITFNIGRICDGQLYLWSPNPEGRNFGNTRVFSNLIFE